MNVKVSKAKLVKAIEAKKAALIALSVIDESRMKKEFAEFRVALLVKLSDFTAKVKASKNTEGITEHLAYNNKFELPRVPSAPKVVNTDRFDKALSALALVEDEFITLNDNRDSDFLSLI